MPLRLAIASDLHAFSIPRKSPKEPSYLNVNDLIGEGERLCHPLAALEDWVERESMTADYLVCPGDLCDRADTAAAQHVWTKLESLAKQLQSRNFFAVTGNHDLDSRFQKEKTYRPEDDLKKLNPPYPVTGSSAAGLNQSYWADNIAIIKEDNVRVLLMNTCATHGSLKKKEIDHGRITPQTLSTLRSWLSTDVVQYHTNIAVCHHHPQLQPDIEDDDYDYMRDGQRLLEMLGTGEFGNWLVIHGHKHHPRLTYAVGGNASPVVFSAGSLSVCLPHKKRGSVHNTFHIVEIHDAPNACSLKGQVYTFEFGYGVGWEPAQENSALPHNVGFGYRGELYAFAASIDALVSGPFVSFTELLRQEPDLRYLLPSDRKIVYDTLRNKYAIDNAFDNERQDLIFYRRTAK